MKKNSGLSPQTAQVDAIERLLEQERFNEALAKANKLAAQYPDHVRIRDLRIQAMGSAGDLGGAGVLALEWTQTHPNSKRAWDLLFGMCMDLGLGFLAYHAHEKLDGLGAINEVRTEEANKRLAGTRAKYLNLDDDEGLRSDRGLLFLFANRAEEACKILASCTHPVPRTNLASTLFDLGRVREAAQMAQEAWTRYSSSSYAARTAIRALLYVGDESLAREIGAHLKSVTVTEPDELAMQMEAFNLLEEFEASKTCYGAFDERKLADYPPNVMAQMLHTAAVAFYQTGERDRANVLWRRAAQEDTSTQLYRYNMSHASQKDSEEPAWAEMMGDRFPTVVARKLSEEIEEAGAEVILEDAEMFDAELDAHSIYLGVILRASDPLLRTLARGELCRRSEDGDADAINALRGMVISAQCTDRERVEALRALYFAGSLPRCGPVDIYLRGRLQSVLVDVPLIQELPMLIDAPDAARDDYFNAVFAAEPAELRHSLGRMEYWLEQTQDPSSRLQLEHRAILLLYALKDKRGVQRLQSAIDAGGALPRTYAFAARAAIAENDLDKAATLLKGQLTRAGTNDEDLSPVLMATQELHAARQEEEQEIAAWIAYEALGAFEVEAA